MKNFTLLRNLTLLVALLFTGTVFAQGTGESEEKAYTVAEAQAAYVEGQTQSAWVKGYIVGYVAGGSLEKDSRFDLTSGDVSASNILLADSKEETDYTKCIPVQLKAGSDFRAAVNLIDNPQNLGKELLLSASLEKYFNVAGLKDPVTEFKLSGESGPVEPAEEFVYSKVSSIESGKTYILGASVDNAVCVAKNLEASKTYGYLYVDNVAEDANSITLTKSTDNFVLTSVDGGYTIQDSYGRYLYMTGTFNSFNVSDERVEGDIWTVEANSDGTFKITNVAMGKYIQYSAQYSSYGSYANENGVMPCLYQLEKSSTGIASVEDAANAPVEVYSLNGVKVGSSLDGLKSGIYLVKKGNKVQKVLK